jgi:hypothetical protein
MNALKKLAIVLGRLWAPVLIMLVVLACGYFVRQTADLPEAHDALQASLAFGLVN